MWWSFVSGLASAAWSLDAAAVAAAGKALGGDTLAALGDGRAFGSLHYVMGWVGLVSFGTYLLPLLYSWWFCFDQDLRKKYGASWALVTGGSSGIGRAIAERCAAQGLNVVIVAVDDKFLKEAVTSLRKDYPDLTFEAVGADLSKDPETYMPAVRAVTDDLDIQCVFINAGFVRTGLLAAAPVGAALANYHVNATSSLVFAHHFLTQMREAGLRGCLCFTSSPAGFIPTPLSVMYGSTKAFLTEFAMSLAAEARSDNVDVCVIHPSPTKTAFYAGNKHNIGAMNFAERMATGPMTVANALFSAVGRVVVRDQGMNTVFFRTLPKILDAVFFTELIARFAGTAADFKAIVKAGKPKPKVT